MNAKSLLIGLGIAALYGVVDYCKLLPDPWGTIAATAAMVLTTLLPMGKFLPVAKVEEKK